MKRFLSSNTKKTSRLNKLFASLAMCFYNARRRLSGKQTKNIKQDEFLKSKIAHIGLPDYVKEHYTGKLDELKTMAAPIKLYNIKILERNIDKDVAQQYSMHMCHTSAEKQAIDDLDVLRVALIQEIHAEISYRIDILCEQLNIAFEDYGELGGHQI